MNGMNTPEYGENPQYNQPPANPQYAPYPQYGQYPPPQSPAPYPHTQKVIRRVPKKRDAMKKWIILGLIGMFVMFAGGFLVTLGHWTPPPQTYDFHGNNANSDYSKAVHSWRNTTNGEKFFGRVIMDFGALLVMTMGFLGAVDSKIDKDERKVLLILGMVALFIFVVMTVGLFVSSVNYYGSY